MDLDAIVAKVAEHEPSTRTVRRRQRHAATALILRDLGDDGPGALFIERAARPGDRWSGHMALPGGFLDPVDDGPLEAAVRETREEVGVDLGRPVGRLDDTGGRVSDVVVSPFVFTVDTEPDLTLDAVEVADALWVPVAHLRSPRGAGEHWHGTSGPFPAIVYRGHPIWGLTYRVIRHFLRVVT